MKTDKNSCNRTAVRGARSPHTRTASTAALPFRNADVSPALLQPTGRATPTSSAQFLIANPRLKFSATPTKQTTEPKANRKKTAIFHPIFPTVAAFLIDTPRFEFSITSTKQTTSQFLIDTESAFCISDLRLPCLHPASMVVFNSIEI